MPINSLNPGYDANKSTITKDATCGNVFKYIPRLVGQSNKEYEQYQTRATYYNVTKRTANALTGAILRKPYTTNIETNDVIVYGRDRFEELLSDGINDLLIHGRVGGLIDYSEYLQSPYIVCYENETIINWRTYEGELILVVLREDIFVPKKDDPYDSEQKVQYRELYLDMDGYYSVRVWQEAGRKQFTVIEEHQPTIRGERLDYIPFVFMNTNGTTPEVTEPVLYNLAQINISHFKTSADIEHAAHFTALPQPWISGDLKEDTKELPIGTYTVWQLDEGASVGYLEFNGNGISSLQEISKQKEDQMALMGASLLQGRKGVESAEALRIRQGAESSTLVNIATAIENGMQQLLSIYFSWLGQEISVEFTLNKDFVSIKLSPQELKALMDAYIAGTISQDTFLQNLYEGEIVEDIEEEKSRQNDNSINT